MKSKLADISKGTRFDVVIADENPLSRRGLRDLLHEDGRFVVVAESDHADNTVKTVLEYKPDIVSLDAALPGTHGLEFVSLLRTRNFRPSIVIFAQDKDERLFNLAISLGVKGFLLERNPPSEVLDCMARVAFGEAYVSPSLTDFLLRRRGKFETLTRVQPSLTELTKTERRILNRIAQGKTSREIAVECGISPRTVDSHRAHICEKLGLSGSNRLLQFALEHRDALTHLD